MKKEQVEKVMNNHDIKEIKYFMFAPGNKIYPNSYREIEVQASDEYIECTRVNGEKEYWSFDNLMGIVTNKLSVEKLKPLDFRGYKNILGRVKEEDYYTKKSWEEYEKVLEENYINLSEAMTNPELYEEYTQRDVDLKVRNIRLAQKYLVKKPNMTAYNSMYETSEAAMKNMTDFSKGQMLSVLKDNKMDQEENSQTEIDRATRLIEIQFRKSQYKANFTEYNMAIEEMNERKDEFTEESWKTYMNIVKANTPTPDATQGQVDAAKRRILTARSVLRKKTSIDKKPLDYTDLNTAKRLVVNLNKETYTEETWKQLELALGMAELTQEEINKKTKAIIEAKNKLEAKSKEDKDEQEVPKEPEVEQEVSKEDKGESEIETPKEPEVDEQEVSKEDKGESEIETPIEQEISDGNLEK